jgi:hypothetical protein
MELHPKGSSTTFDDHFWPWLANDNVGFSLLSAHCTATVISVWSLNQDPVPTHKGRSGFSYQ